VWVGSGDEVGLDGGWEAFSPDEGLKGCISGEPGAPHSRAAGIGSPNGHWEIWYHFTQACGSGTDVQGQVVQVRQGVPHGSFDADAVFVGVSKTRLERAEETAAARNGEDHAAQFAESFVPVLHGHAVASAEVFQDLEEAQTSVFRELNGFSHRVDYPTKENFSGGPFCIAFCKLA